MLVRVKHNELNDFAKNVRNNSSDLELEIEKMLEQLEVLRGIWQGQDSDIFYKSAYNYLNSLKEITHTLNVFSEFIKRTDLMYIESDNQFARQMEQEVNYDE